MKKGNPLQKPEVIHRKRLKRERIRKAHLLGSKKIVFKKPKIVFSKKTTKVGFWQKVWNFIKRTFKI